MKKFCCFCLLVICCRCVFAQPIDQTSTIRIQKKLDNGWISIMNQRDIDYYDGFQNTSFLLKNWIPISVPHNWDQYGGYRRLKKGNLHGYAWYRKVISMDSVAHNRRYFLWFQGVGSYATVWLNGDSVGYHAGGRISFTIEITDQLRKGMNLLAVRADHPDTIRDLPWVGGAGSKEWGFSEGSQPLGIFRPVYLISTGKVRIVPFGIHVWNTDSINIYEAKLYGKVTLDGCLNSKDSIKAVISLKDSTGQTIRHQSMLIDSVDRDCKTLSFTFDSLVQPHLWSPENPYLYQVEVQLFTDNQLSDQLTIPYGIRWIKWDFRSPDKKCFYINGKCFYINGSAEYEHLLGGSHAFSDDQIITRVAQLRAAGFNAFRDAHQPHNLLYQQLFEKQGILWWPQMAAHIWFDRPDFRKNFKKLLHDWIIERRNNPAAILWGLENESTLPESFADSCSMIIRKLDPTASSQRLITTCNGGSGTDWNVIQNWSGTYGGDPYNYGNELKQQLLNGEYGGWRSIDFHAEGAFKAGSPHTEEQFCELMELKITQALMVKDSVFGQFQWLLCSHDNPGRIQSGEGVRNIDRLGPVNYKGLFTIWGEPVDAFYLFRSAFVNPHVDPMVYIVSHTWPDRWFVPGLKDDIRVYSNCDSVELFNGVFQNSLGVRKNPGKGCHFVWNRVPVKTNVLTANAYFNGKCVATDAILLHQLPEDPDLKKLSGTPTYPMTLDSGMDYIYRINCGGPDYVDSQGNKWEADVHFSDSTKYGSQSWTDDYKELPPFYGSQRRIFVPVRGTNDWPLFQTFRYGRNRLCFNFPLAQGNYVVHLFFTEPWYGAGGAVDCKGWRKFDVALNGKVCLHGLDIWKESGFAGSLVKTIPVTVKNGFLSVSFPNVESGQAVISAIAIARKPESIGVDVGVHRADLPNPFIHHWLDTGDSFEEGEIYSIADLPADLYAADWCSFPLNQIQIPDHSMVYLVMPDTLSLPEGYRWTKNSVCLVSREGSFKKYPVCRKSMVNGGKFVDQTMTLKPLLMAIQPFVKLHDPVDLRKEQKFLLKDARIDQIKEGKNVLTRLQWKTSFGLASFHSIQIRCLLKTSDDKKIKMLIKNIDNHIIFNQRLLDVRGGQIKAQTIRTDTGSQINAGNYVIIIEYPVENNLRLEWLKIQ